METMILRAKTDLNSFTYISGKNLGSSSCHSVRYRNLGPHKDKSGEFYTLGDGLLLWTETSEGSSALIRPPAMIKKGDFVEIEKTSIRVNAFPADEEFIGKNAIFPIQDLSMRSEFQDAKVKNCAGRITAGFVAEEFQALAPTDTAVGCALEFCARNLRPGRRVLVTWHWLAQATEGGNP
ncbi:MAG TPA: hypothetical protein VHR45_03160 [Thermoanaerobaculia bacterium]|nr:hypothetical protein [Thermoanaerobaculia bacterium]